MKPATCERTPEPHEFMPADFFKEVTKAEIFPGDRPLEVDLGCGDGKFLLEMAEHHTDRDFLGVERLLGRVRKVCRKAQKRDLENLKVLRLESRYVVEWLLAPASVSRLHLLCPDPWPKARHHRRRLIQEDFLNAVVRVLQPGGEFLFKTDHDEYFEWAEEKVAEFRGLERLDWPEDAFFYPKTDFQLQWEAEGKRLQGIRLRKPDAPAD
ncbi:tRNA (guanosine(46)-N7)-methyltransferase TrmB [Haloferula rosea]|uniref:tRNA (guanine-N(7)-)-methyltransferase n=1 Tax=Haloferula rosea TaxID=490093 RepID=A0A934VFS1_9BACT|nr:tRNA (guanosine(46)-N7)-methyltransferase TrmB [Haloferula rosea]MBK1828649.1 tRNA (guanosine(46)-N7)-methyltransferase TrmB [Haloferula rosea]